LSTLGATAGDLKHDLARGYLRLVGQPFAPPLSPPPPPSLEAITAAAAKAAVKKTAAAARKAAAAAAAEHKGGPSKKYVSTAGAKELRRERNERRAKLREGEVHGGVH
jgi:hypothetical protein